MANALYRDAPDLVVVELDGTLLDVRVVVEDTYGTGTSYPHVYGPISVRAQIGEHGLVRRADGGWTVVG